MLTLNTVNVLINIEKSHIFDYCFLEKFSLTKRNCLNYLVFQTEISKFLYFPMFSITKSRGFDQSGDTKI